MILSRFAIALASRILVACVALAAGHAYAQAPADGSVVLVSNSLARITLAEYNAELLKLPIDLRAGFANTPRRVNDLLMRMLVQKSLATQARAAKLDATPEAVARIELEVERQLSQIMIESVEIAAGAEFDANRGKFEARARELYILEKGKYATPEQASATHILFDTKKRTSEEARALARDTRAKIAAGADMGKLARDLSDDPSSGNNSGTLGWFAKAEMDPAFGDAAFALKNPGDLSEPVLSQFGWHVIRLDGKRPASTRTFEEAKETVMAELRKRYVDEKREEAVNAVRRDPKTQVNRAAVDALTPRIDLEAARRALGMTPPGAPPAATPVAPK
jgi:peptidyl-prolyl cis-trans isomerase C